MNRAWRPAAIGMLLVVAGVIVAGALTGYGWYGQIRLDCGDLRYCFLGVPVFHERMPEPTRSALLNVSANSEQLVPAWRTCVTYPLPTSNNTDAMCRSFYSEAAAWIKVDRTIARLALEDVAAYIIKTHARYGLPASTSILGPDVVDWDTGLVISDWRSNWLVQSYCQDKGYAPPQEDTARANAGENP